MSDEDAIRDLYAFVKMGRMVMQIYGYTSVGHFRNGCGRPPSTQMLASKLWEAMIDLDIAYGTVLSRAEDVEHALKKEDPRPS